MGERRVGVGGLFLLPFMTSQCILARDTESDNKGAGQNECNIVLSLYLSVHLDFYAHSFTLCTTVVTQFVFRRDAHATQNNNKVTNLLCQARNNKRQCAENVATATQSPYASRHHQKTIFTFLLVNHQLLFESKTNDRRFSPLAHHHVGRTAKPGSLMNARPRQAGGK